VEKRQFMLTRISSIARPFLRFARPSLLLIVCVVIAAALSQARCSQSDSEMEPSGERPLAAHGANRQRIGSEGSSDAAAAPFQLTEQQQRGKQVYTTGISPTGGKMTAVLGNSTSELPAMALKCVNCHLQNGRGKPEGGITPSNIRWDELSKPYGSTTARGRRRPPYDAPLLKRSITMGLDSAGESLDQAMPRYRMTHGDLADLVAYLLVIGKEVDPGLRADRVRIGVIVAPSRLFPEMSLAVRAALTAFVAEINQAGGIYQRDIELCFTESPSSREDRADAAIEFVKREQLFALAASFVAGDEVEIARRLDMEGVPLVGAMALYPQTGFPLNRHVFYMSSGLQGQCRALIRFAHDRCAGELRSAALLFPEDKDASDNAVTNDGLSELAKSIEEGCANLGWRLQRFATSAQGNDQRVWAQRLAGTKAAVVFSLLAGEQTVQFLQAAAAHEWYPTCFLLGDLVGRQLFDAPPGFDRRIFLSLGSLPSQLPAGMSAHSTLADKYKLPTAHLAAQFECLAAMNALVQALQQSGAGLSRERLIEQLETFREYRTGFAPPLTFGPNRRVGANGAYVVTMDLINKKLVAVSDWVDGRATTQSDL
jgi:ABC-type branched-subunit amino acid transport system substrate-binding protein